MTTDFGTSDHYVGAMKGAILRAFPPARIVDISHRVEPQAVSQGAYMLSAAYAHFPLGTVHLAVVDPGVGSQRRGIAVQTDKYWFLGPDNGVLSWALELEGSYEACELPIPQDTRVSATFHARDVFAPAAARLAAGGAFGSLGPRVSGLVELERFTRGPEPDVWRTKVVHVDRFGNLICGLRISDLGKQGAGPTIRNAQVELDGKIVSGIETTYSDVSQGQLLALFSSSGHLEIAVSSGSAAALLGAVVETNVRLRLPANGSVH